ncbi:MAG: cell division protein FtsA [Breznakibacter sp.]|nr:cell division protein FtsA [Breznakibacter sp.]
MSQESNIIAAIDIGTTKIVATAGRRMPNGQISVLGVEQVVSTGVKRGVILNIEETVSAIRKVLQALEQRLNVKIVNVFVGIAGQHIRSMQNKVYTYIDPNMEIKLKDVDTLYKDNERMYVEPGLKILHIIPQDYCVDQETGVKSPIGMSGRKFEGTFHIVMASDASLQNIHKCVTRAGLHLQELMLEPLASARSTITNEEKEIGVVLVDIGGGTTDVAVFHDGILRHTAVVPLGGHVVTNDIKEGCSVLPKQAESLKVNYGSALGDMAREDMVITLPGVSQGWESKEISCKTLSYIIQARMEEIIDFVCHEIEASGYYDKLGAGVVLTGGGAMLKNLTHLFKFRSGLDVRIGRPNIFAVDAEAYVDQPACATAIGLLLCGFESRHTPVVEMPKLFDEPVVEKPVEAPVKQVAKKPAKEEGKKNKMGSLFSTLVEGFESFVSYDDDKKL